MESETVKVGTQSELVPIKLAAHLQNEEGKLKQVKESVKFQQYITGFQTERVKVNSITIISIFMFGDKIGFVDLQVDCQFRDSKNEDMRIPGYVFLRGKSVGVLVILNGNYILVTEQFRVPAGRFCLECPAGMMDEQSKNFSGVAAKEIEEETSLKINESDLKSLGKFYPSQGGCDEELELFVLEKNLEESKINELLQKTHGSSINEVINLKLIKNNWQEVLNTKDSKLICAYSLYKNQ